MNLEDFNEFYSKTYPSAVTNIQSQMSATDLPNLKKLAIGIIFLLEDGIVTFPKDFREKFITNFYSKLAQEILGLIGCLEAGSVYSAFHPARAILEMQGILKYIFEKNTDKRLERFNEFPDLARYQMYLHAAGTPEHPGNARTLSFFSKQEIERLQNKVPHWEKLWDVKKTKTPIAEVPHWYYPKPISFFVNMVLAEIPDQEGFLDMYDLFSHITHFSPVGASLFNKSLFVQSEEMDQVDMCVNTAIMQLIEILRLTDEFFNTKLLRELQLLIIPLRIVQLYLERNGLALAGE